MKKLNMALSLVERTKLNGGLTFNLTNKAFLGGQSYYAVAMYPECEIIIDLNLFDEGTVYEYIHENIELLRDKRNSLGTWIDTENNKVYLDISRTISDFDDAIQCAKANSQLAIFDLLELKEIRL